MGTTYTKEEILAKVDEWLTPKNISMLYAQDFVNYMGMTADTKESYTEIIAAHLLEHLPAFEEVKKITKESSYDAGHERKEIDHSSPRQEEQIARSMKGHTFDSIGEIIDYQTPLKNVQGDKAGKVDLLSWNEKDGCAYILEFKLQNSQETLLRCVLEIDTYNRILDSKKLLIDFKLPIETAVRKAALVYGQSRLLTQLDGVYVKKLMKALGVDLFVLSSDNKVVEKAYRFEELEV